MVITVANPRRRGAASCYKIFPGRRRRAGCLTLRVFRPTLGRMKGMRNRRPCVLVTAVGVLLGGWIATSTMHGGDLVTLSGVTYHDVQPVRVEPDGVTWRYAEGVCKVDFSDSPKSVCETYHYDAAKAAAYRAEQAQAQQQAEERTRQILKESDERRLARMQASAAAAASSAPVGTDVIFRRAASPAASEATRALGAQMEAALAKQATAATAAGAIGNTKVGSFLTNMGILHLSHPAEVLNKDEYKADLHHAPLDGYSPSTARDEFYTPDYATKSFNDDLDRAAAFASGVPLKP